MGRGGDKAVVAKEAVHLKVEGGSKGRCRAIESIESLSTEELRKKAKQYGHDDSLDREALLRELVSKGATSSSSYSVTKRLSQHRFTLASLDHTLLYTYTGSLW